MLLDLELEMSLNPDRRRSCFTTRVHYITIIAFAILIVIHTYHWDLLRYTIEADWGLSLYLFEFTKQICYLDLLFKHTTQIYYSDILFRFTIQIYHSFYHSKVPCGFTIKLHRLDILFIFPRFSYPIHAWNLLYTFTICA